MRTTEQWLQEKISDYNENPKDTLEEMLATTNNVIEQYIQSPNDATLGLLNACMKHNNLFLKKLRIIM